MPPRTFSHSRINTFENCPYQYKLRYIDGIKVEAEGIEAFMGSRVHEVLEKLYQDKTRCKENTPEDLLDYYGELWEKKWHDNVIIVRKGYTPQNYKDMGTNAIVEYYSSYHPFEEGKVLGLEKQISVPFGDDVEYKFTGFIDRLMLLPDGRYEIHDYKASGTLPEQKKLDADRQLALYQLAVEDLWDDAKDNVELVWHYLLFDKEMRSKRTGEQLSNLVGQVIKTIETIEGTEEFEPKESALCAWCVYQEFCPRKKHEAKVESLPADEFLEEDGVKLVNKYVETEAKIKELEKLKEELKEAVFRYSEKGGITKITGSSHSLRIGTQEQMAIPSRKNEPGEYEALVKLLKNTRIYEEVSVVDRWLLKEKLKHLDRNLAEMFGPFKRVEEKKRIYKSKRKDIEE